MGTDDLAASARRLSLHYRWRPVYLMDYSATIGLMKSPFELRLLA
jgi:hypothetical protein